MRVVDAADSHNRVVDNILDMLVVGNDALHRDRNVDHTRDRTHKAHTGPCTNPHTDAHRHRRHFSLAACFHRDPGRKLHVDLGPRVSAHASTPAHGSRHFARPCQA